MPDISKINAVAVADIEKLDSILAANIEKVNGLTFATAPAFTGLLDTYTGAAAGYSTRKLKTGVTVAARLRRSGDNIEADVEFDSNNEISLTSPISNASSGTYTDLADFVDHATTPRDAFVKEWKDQSGSGNHATQTTTTSQPQLYDATTGLITENGKPALQHQDVNGGLEITYTGNNPTTIAAVMANLGGGTPTTREPIPILNQASGTPYAFRSSPSGGINSAYRGFGTSPNSFLNSVEDNDLTLSEMATAFELSQGLVIGIGDSSGWTGSTTYLGWKDPQMFQEVIFWPSDQDSAGNINGIEENINTEYLIYQPTDAPTSGLLYDYGSATGGTDAAAAYSVRQLSDKAILCMRIRRDMGAGNPGDDDEINIGFDANGDLDTQAISDFCGTGTGYVTRWWDQSVNGNHADQPVGGTGSNTSQPQIYNGTAVITENGKPALDFDGVGQYFQSNGFADDFNGEDVEMSFTSVSSPDVTGDFFMWGLSGTNSTWQTCYLRSTVNIQVRKIDDSSTSSPSTKTGSYSTGQQLFTAVSNGTTTSVYVDTSAQVNAASINVGASTFTTATVGASPTPSAYLNGQMQELVLWVADQSSNRAGIETNIDTYYQIPGM